LVDALGDLGLGHASERGAPCCSITFTSSVEASAVIASEIARMRMGFGTAAPRRH
jgi:hypothetical protein